MSAGTLILCLTGGAVAAASMTPAPTSPSTVTTAPSAPGSTLAPVPPPGDIVKMVTDTATSVVDKVTTAAGQPKKPTSGPERQPATTPAVHLPARPAHPAATAAKPALPSWSTPSGADFSAAVPTLPTAWDLPVVRTPVVAAGALTGAPAAGVHDAISPANDPTGRGSDVMRGVLVALAVAAAATIGAGHVTVARSRA